MALCFPCSILFLLFVVFYTYSIIGMEVFSGGNRTVYPGCWYGDGHTIYTSQTHTHAHTLLDLTRWGFLVYPCMHASVYVCRYVCMFVCMYLPHFSLPVECSEDAWFGVGQFYSNNGSVQDNPNVYWLNNFDTIGRSYGTEEYGTNLLLAENVTLLF